MAEWDVPGLALAVVRGGKTVLARGYGLRDLRKKLEVTPDTLFAIGSCTKAFTAAALGILADEKKLDWDTPVRDCLPSFRLHDPVATERTTIRDLLCHRTGLPRHDRAWYGADATRRDLLGRLRHLEPSKDFRSCWQYQNLMYMVAGMVVEEVTGKTWEEFVRERMLVPLGMERTNLCVADSQRDQDFALPYARKGNRVSKTDFYDLTSVAPAGSINSSVSEMANWLRLNLRAGKWGRKQIVSAAALKEIHTPQAVIQGALPDPELSHPMYGLGWMVSWYRGHQTLSHGGGIDGFQAHVTLLPRQKAGVVVLTNLAGHQAQTLVDFYLQDQILGLDPAPWLRRARAAQEKQKKREAARKRNAARERKKAAKPSRGLKAFTGEYRNDGYGALRIELKKRKLLATYNGITCALEHVQRDVFECVYPAWGRREKVSFPTGAEGQFDRVEIALEPAMDPIVFRRAEEH